MQQFLVPQFIDVESKLLGPITVRQFIIMLVAGLFCVLWYKLFDFGLFALTSVITVGVFVVVAFVKVNGRRFHYFVLSLFQTFRSPKIRVWNKEKSIAEIKQLMSKPKKTVVAKSVIARPKVTKGRLSELSLIVNTGGVYRGKEEE